MSDMSMHVDVLEIQIQIQLVLESENDMLIFTHRFYIYKAFALV